MRTTTAAPPAPGTPAQGSPPEQENKAALGFAVAGFCFFGPAGLVVSVLAVGIERAFLKSGWEQPGWTQGEWRPELTPQQREERRAEARKLAREYLEQARAKARERSAEWERFGKDYKNWVAGGKTGDQPVRPTPRSATEFMGDFMRASKSWGKLFGEKAGNAYAKTKDFNDRADDFSRRLWNWLTGFAEGIRDGIDQAKQRLREEQQKLDEDWEGPARPQGQPLTGPAGTDRTGTTNPGQPGQPGPRGPGGPTSTDDQVRPPLRVDATLGPQPTPIPVSDAGPGTDPAGGAQQRTEPTDPATTPRILGEWPEGPATLAPPQQPAGAGTPAALEGELMDNDGRPVVAAADGDTNLDRIYQALEPAAPLIASLQHQLMELRPRQIRIAQLTGKISRMKYRGVPLVSQQMIDACQQATGQMNQGTIRVVEQLPVAQELTEEALIGLQPARQDLHEVHSQGASGDLFRAAGTEEEG